MNLAAWARANGVHPQTADRWLRQGTMPVPARRLLADPRATMIVVEHRDRLARFGVEYLEAALSAQARRLAVVDPGETSGDLAGAMVDVLTGVYARLDGRRGARNRALRAVTCANQSRGHAGAAGTQGG